jgi:CBS domain-containing protein
MSEPLVIHATVSLYEAITDMSRYRYRSQIVVDDDGRVVGMLTLENLAEMMMIHNMQPGWHFLKRVS